MLLSQVALTYDNLKMDALSGHIAYDDPRADCDSVSDHLRNVP